MLTGPENSIKIAKLLLANVLKTQQVLNDETTCSDFGILEKYPCKKLVSEMFAISIFWYFIHGMRIPKNKFEVRDISQAFFVALEDFLANYLKLESGEIKNMRSLIARRHDEYLDIYKQIHQGTDLIKLSHLMLQNLGNPNPQLMQKMAFTKAIFIPANLDAIKQIFGIGTP